MESMIYDPLKEFDSKYKQLHQENTQKYFNDLVERSGVDPEENAKTVKAYHTWKEDLSKLKKKYTLWRILRVLMIITLILIPLVIWKVTPRIRALRTDITQADDKVSALYEAAVQQMTPLNDLFTDQDALRIMETTLPDISFSPCFSHEQEKDMRVNYDFEPPNDAEHSTLDLLAGQYRGNPFLFEKQLIHEMGTALYHGYKTIHWTETYRDSNGRTQTRTRSETLHATVTKPKPQYHTQICLHYFSQGGPELCFSRQATSVHTMSEKEVERYVKKGEKKLKKKTDEAIQQNGNFMSMSNTEFEVLFGALDRTNEVQFRTLFTPLAQTNMVSLLRSQSGFGDDFSFEKKNRSNLIISAHSQNRPLTLSPSLYRSYSFEEIKHQFVQQNMDHFKAVYFDLAPLWAIPLYQERPVQSLQPIPDYAQKYSCMECEALSNMMEASLVVHPNTKTQAILKSAVTASDREVDEVCVSAYSYDIAQRIDLVPVFGGDGRWHNVPVSWDEYLPLEVKNSFFVASSAVAEQHSVEARHHDVCIFK